LDLHATDTQGRTALHHAAENDNFEAAELLLEAGLDITHVDNWGTTPIQITLFYHEQFALNHLPEVDNVRSKEYGSILNTASFAGTEDVVDELLKRVPEAGVHEYVNLYCDKGTPLYRAASNGHIPIMEKLVEKGAKINLVGGPCGSPLMGACTMGYAEAVAWLLSKGTELQCTKFDGTTITAEAAGQQHEAVLWVLRRFKEEGVECLDEEIPVKTANISKLDEFMVGYKERKARVPENSPNRGPPPLPPDGKKDDKACNEEVTKKDDEEESKETSKAESEETTVAD
jgi:ankyrin repeat protein